MNVSEQQKNYKKEGCSLKSKKISSLEEDNLVEK